MAGRILLHRAIVVLVMFLAHGAAIVADDGVWALPGSGIWSEPASWIGGVPNAAGDIASVNDLSISNAVIVLGEDITVGAFDVANGGLIRVTGANTLILDAGDLAESRIVVADRLGQLEIRTDLVITSGQTAEFGLPSAIATLRLSGDISGGGALRKTGSGFLTLDGYNDAWSGPLLIESGRVLLENGARLGTSVAGVDDGTRIEAGGVLALDTFESGEVGGELFTLAGGRIEFAGFRNIGDEPRQFDGVIHVPSGFEGEFVALGPETRLRMSGGITGDSLYLRNGGGEEVTFEGAPVNLTGTLTMHNVRFDGQRGHGVIFNVPVVADDLVMRSRFSPARPSAPVGQMAGKIELNADSQFGHIKIEDGAIIGYDGVVSVADPVIDIWDGALSRAIEGLTDVHKWTPQRAEVASQDGIEYRVRGGILGLSDAAIATNALVRIEADHFAAVQLYDETYFDVDLNNARGTPTTGALLAGHPIYGDIHLGAVGSVIQARGDLHLNGDVTGGSLTAFGSRLYVDSDATYSGPTIVGRGGERAELTVRGSIFNSPEIIVNTRAEFSANASGLHPVANVKLRGGEFTGRGSGGTIPMISLESGGSSLQVYDDIRFTIGALNRNDTATVRFRALNNFELGEDNEHAPRIFFETTPSLDDEILGGWAVIRYRDEMNINQTDFATYSNDLGVIPLSTVGRVSMVANGQPTDNVRIDGAQIPLMADTTINSLTFSDSGASEYVDLDGHTLTIDSGGILCSSFGSSAVIENGTLTSGVKQLFVQGGLEVRANITDGPAGALDLVLDSTDELIISGANTYTGATEVRGSEVRMTAAASLPVGTELLVEAANFVLDFTPDEPVKVGTLRLREDAVIRGAPVEATRYELESGIFYAQLHGDADVVKTTEGTVRIVGPGSISPLEHFAGNVLVYDGLLVGELGHGGFGTTPITVYGGVVEFWTAGPDYITADNDIVLDGGSLSVRNPDLVLAGTVEVRSDSSLLTFEASFDAGRFINNDPDATSISVRGPLILHDGVTLRKLGLGELHIEHLQVGADTTLDIDVMSVDLTGRIVSNATGASLDIVSSTTGDGFARVDASLVARQGESLSLLKDGALFEVAVAGTSNEIAGGGTIVNDLIVVDGASVRPGHSVGTLTSGGTVTLAPGALLDWEISNPGSAAGPGVGWDFLNVAGTLQFAGTADEPVLFELTSINSLGDVGPLDSFDRLGMYEWLVASADSLVDSSLEEIYVDGTTFFELNNSPSSATLSLEFRGNELYAVYELIPTPADGDADGNGIVDGEDYLLWSMNYGAIDPPDVLDGPSDGDFNSDGAVNGIDYLIWASNYGAGSGVVSAVPEPAGLSLLAIGLAGCVLMQRTADIKYRRRGTR